MGVQGLFGVTGWGSGCIAVFRMASGLGISAVKAPLAGAACPLIDPLKHPLRDTERHFLQRAGRMSRTPALPKLNPKNPPPPRALNP